MIDEPLGRDDSRSGDQPYAAAMVDLTAPAPRQARRDVRVVLLVQAVATVLVAGWFAVGHASAPDGGLHQLDVLSLSEAVPGLSAVDGRPTLVAVTCDVSTRSPLDPAFGLRLVDDPALARRLALPRAVAPTCTDGYVLLDGRSRVRYRTYDPGWREHAFEQEVLLEHLLHSAAHRSG